LEGIDSVQEGLINLMRGTDKIIFERGFFRSYPWHLNFHEWKRFAVFHLTIHRDSTMAYLYPLIKVYGKSAIYPNNDAAALTQLMLWINTADHFFEASFEGAIAALDESGITNYLESRADISFQTDILKDVRKKHGVMQYFNLVGFAEKSLSNKLTTTDDNLLQGGKSMRPAKVIDFLALWAAVFLLLYGFFVSVHIGKNLTV